MSYSVRIRNNETQETRTFEEPGDWHEGSIHWWTNGNMGCDCNLRALFHGTATSVDSLCGVDGYTVRDITLPDGTVVQIEEQDLIEDLINE